MPSSPKGPKTNPPLVKISPTMVADFEEDAGRCFKLKDLIHFIGEKRGQWEIPTSMPAEAVAPI
jgi:hypothetical protein